MERFSRPLDGLRGIRFGSRGRLAEDPRHLHVVVSTSPHIWFVEAVEFDETLGCTMLACRTLDRERTARWGAGAVKVLDRDWEGPRGWETDRSAE